MSNSRSPPPKRSPPPSQSCAHDVDNDDIYSVIPMIANQMVDLTTLTIPWDVDKHYAYTTVVCASGLKYSQIAPLVTVIDRLRSGKWGKVTDIWVPTQYRVVISIMTKRLAADRFVFKCNTNQIQCHGRFVRAHYQISRSTVEPQYLVYIFNINRHIKNKQIDLWLSTFGLCRVGHYISQTCEIPPDNYKYTCILQFDKECKHFRDQLTLRKDLRMFNQKLTFRVWEIDKNQMIQVEQKQSEMEAKVDNKNDEQSSKWLDTGVTAQLQLQIEKQQLQISSLHTQINTVANQYKTQLLQVHARYNELFVKYAVLKRGKMCEGQDKDCSEWKLWTWEDVLVWILNLDNGRYVKYKNHIIANICRHNINGLSLTQMTSENWNHVGVTDVNDQALLVHHIYRLIALKNRNQSQPFPQEGQPN
eukprot:156283_1